MVPPKVTTPITVYSSVVGGYDDLDILLDSQPAESPVVRYVLFTDTVRQTSFYKGWELRPLMFSHPESARISRFHKINSDLVLPDTNISVWLDGTQRIKEGVDIEAMVKSVMAQHDVATFKHPVRSCIYEELRACISYKKDSTELMVAHVDKYRKEGYPPSNGLVETACVVRNHNEKVRKFNELWWYEIKNGSRRDQLSFNYVAWRLDTAYQTIPGKRTSSHFFQFMPHVNMRKSRRRKKRRKVKKK